MQEQPEFPEFPELIETSESIKDFEVEYEVL